MPGRLDSSVAPFSSASSFGVSRTTPHCQHIRFFSLTPPDLSSLAAIPAVLIQEKLVKPRYWISFNMLILAGAQIGMGFVTNAARVLVVRC